MKHPLYLFNPDHDLALANHEVNYMAPASARCFANDLALLPLWYATANSRVLAPSAYNQTYIEEMDVLFHFSSQLVTEPELEQLDSVEVRPWGWNLSVRKRLATLGVAEDCLLTPEQIEQQRQLSHRAQAVALLPILQMSEFFCGESTYLTSPDEWRQFVEASSMCLLKAPLSGSGKGLNWCKGVFTPSLAGWCAHVGAQQGGVVGEPIYDKVEDFAMEFYSSGDGQVTFAGYSLFQTGGSGAYESNVLASDAWIEQRLAEYVPVEELRMLSRQLEKELSSRIGRVYTGYLGVDMMICRFSSFPNYRIHPCVEINLRMNMGVVARLLHDQFVSPQSMGSFRIDYHPLDEDALQDHLRLSALHPLEVEDGKVRSGYLALTPVHKKTHYRAWILITATDAFGRE